MSSLAATATFRVYVDPDGFCDKSKAGETCTQRDCNKVHTNPKLRAQIGPKVFESHVFATGIATLSTCETYGFAIPLDRDDTHAVVTLRTNRDEFLFDRTFTFLDPSQSPHVTLFCSRIMTADQVVGTGVLATYRSIRNNPLRQSAPEEHVETKSVTMLIPIEKGEEAGADPCATTWLAPFKTSAIKD